MKGLNASCCCFWHSYFRDISSAVCYVTDQIKLYRCLCTGVPSILLVGGGGGEWLSLHSAAIKHVKDITLCHLTLPHICLCPTFQPSHRYRETLCSEEALFPLTVVSVYGVIEISLYTVVNPSIFSGLYLYFCISGGTRIQFCVCGLIVRAK